MCACQREGSPPGADSIVRISKGDQAPGFELTQKRHKLVRRVRREYAVQLGDPPTPIHEQQHLSKFVGECSELFPLDLSHPTRWWPLEPVLLGAPLWGRCAFVVSLRAKAQAL